MSVTAIRSEEIAATVGSTSSRRVTNIRRVSVAASPPLMNRATTTSSSEVMKASRAPEKTEKRICGRVTVRKARSREAPRLRATRSWFMS